MAKTINVTEKNNGTVKDVSMATQVSIGSIVKEMGNAYTNSNGMSNRISKEKKIQRCLKNSLEEFGIDYTEFKTNAGLGTKDPYFFTEDLINFMKQYVDSDESFGSPVISKFELLVSQLASFLEKNIGTVKQKGFVARQLLNANLSPEQMVELKKQYEEKTADIKKNLKLINQYSSFITQRLS